MKDNTAEEKETLESLIKDFDVLLGQMPLEIRHLINRAYVEKRLTKAYNLGASDLAEKSKEKIEKEKHYPGVSFQYLSKKLIDNSLKEIIDNANEQRRRKTT